MIAGTPVQPYFSGKIAVDASQFGLGLMPHRLGLSGPPREIAHTSLGGASDFAAANAPSIPSSSIDATMMWSLPGRVVRRSVTSVRALSSVASKPTFLRFTIGPGQTDWKPLR